MYTKKNQRHKSLYATDVMYESVSNIESKAFVLSEFNANEIYKTMIILVECRGCETENVLQM